MKSKMVLEQWIGPVSKEVKYKVISLINRTRPLIGDELTEEDVKKLMSEIPDLSVEIKNKKQK